MPPTVVRSSVRRRVIWDSVQVTAATTGALPFFSSQAGKSDLQMRPKLSGEIPAGQRASVDAMTIALPSGFGMAADSIALDSAFAELVVEDQLGASVKIRDIIRGFPAGGGVDGLAAIGADLTTIEPISNGKASVLAIYRFAPAVVIEGKIRFRANVNIPSALGGLTTGRWIVALHTAWEFFLG